MDPEHFPPQPRESPHPSPAPHRAPTFGESRIRLSYGEWENPKVHQLKRLCAHLIDEISTNCAADPRLSAMAVTQVETACLYAVKAATTPAEV